MMTKERIRRGYLVGLAFLVIPIGLIAANDRVKSRERIFDEITAIVETDIPTIAEVGAHALPSEIAPVQAPFPMPEFKKPNFPLLKVNIEDMGAKQNILATKSMQLAIDEVNRKGGGTVLIPAGDWITGRITLKSNVNLFLSEGAKLHFSGEIKDYLPAVFTRNEGIEIMSLGALIYANGQENIAITGKGKLIGPADVNSPLRTKAMTAVVIEKVVHVDKPVSERVYEGKNDDFIFPPMFISPINCRNVYIEGITLENTAFWNIVPIYCDGVIIRGVTIKSVGIPRGDGIDVESSRNVLIEYSTLSCGDDCFTIKAGRNEDGIRVNKPSENIVIRYCLAQKGAGGITCGSETAGMIRNVYVHDCVFDGTDSGIRFKTRRSRGGGGENLTYERIRMTLRGDAFNFDMLGSKKYMGELAERLPARAVNKLTPTYKNIKASNIIVEGAQTFVNINGIPESPVRNILIEGARVNSKKLFSASDASGITIRNASISSTDNLIRVSDSHKILFENVQFNIPGNRFIVSGNTSSNVSFLGCNPEKSK